MHARRLLGAALMALALISIATPARAQLDDRYPRVAMMSAGDVTAAVRCTRSKRCKPGKPRTGMWAPVFAAVTAPARFIAGRLVCAVNVGAALAARGIKGTGSALAKSYLAWGRPSGPTPGAVAVFDRGARGGHVAIVHSIKADGTVNYLNPSSRRQAWVIGPYLKRPIAFRAAS
jgi:hypothetical protein